MFDANLLFILPYFDLTTFTTNKIEQNAHVQWLRLYGEGQEDDHGHNGHGRAKSTRTNRVRTTISATEVSLSLARACGTIFQFNYNRVMNYEFAVQAATENISVRKLVNLTRALCDSCFRRLRNTLTYLITPLLTKSSAASVIPCIKKSLTYSTKWNVSSWLRRQLRQCSLLLPDESFIHI